MKTVLCLAISATLVMGGTALANDHDELFPEGVVDTSEDISFGFSLVSSPSSLIEWGDRATLDYWLSDKLAIGGALSFSKQSQEQGELEFSETQIDLACIFTYVVYAGKTTRLTVGGGLGAGYVTTDDGDGDTDEGAPYMVSLPVQFSLEHFFTETISVGLNAGAPLYTLYVDDDGNSDTDDLEMSGLSLDTSVLGLELTWYTD